MSKEREMTHTWSFTLKDMAAMGLAVSFAIEKSHPESVFRQEWQRLKEEVRVKVEKVTEYERSQLKGEPK